MVILTYNQKFYAKLLLLMLAFSILFAEFWLTTDKTVSILTATGEIIFYLWMISVVNQQK